MAKGAWKGILKDEVDLSGCNIKDGQQVIARGKGLTGQGRTQVIEPRLFNKLWEFEASVLFCFFVPVLFTSMCYYAVVYMSNT